MERLRQNAKIENLFSKVIFTFSTGRALYSTDPGASGLKNRNIDK